MVALDHLLMGTALGLCEPSLNPYIFAAALGGSLLPDVDNIHGGPGTIGYLVRHRTYSHSLIVAPFFSLILSVFIKVMGADVSLWSLWTWSFIGVLLHLLVDVLNSFGTMIWWPLNRRKVSLYLIFEFDIAFSGVFAGVVLLEFFFQKMWNIPVYAFMVSVLTWMGLYIFWRRYSRNRFYREVIKIMKTIPDDVIKVSVVPAKYFKWKGIIVTPKDHHVIREGKEGLNIEIRPIVAIPEEMLTRTVKAYRRYAHHLDVVIEGSQIFLQNLIYSPTTFCLTVDFKNKEKPSSSISMPSIRPSDY